MKYRIFALCASILTLPSQGAVTFVGFDADSEQFSFISDVDIASGTQIFFTDEEWNGSSFTDTEGTISLTLSAILNAGKVVTIDGPTDSVTGVTGTLFHEDSSFNLSVDGDNINAYLGSVGMPTSHLGALEAGHGTLSGGGVFVDLSDDFAGVDVFAYTGPTSGEASFADYATLIQDPNNWTAQGDGTGDQSANYSPPGDFTVIPEPSIALFGLASLSLLGRRRRSL